MRLEERISLTTLMLFFFAPIMRSVRAVILCVLVVGVCASVGCSSRAKTKPRSVVMSEAESSGAPYRSVEEERDIFIRSEQLHRDRLMSLIRSRSGGEIREANYRIGAGDEIELNVFDVPELNLTVRVRQSGYITLPLVGGVAAAGLTEADLHAELEKRLAAYVKRPQVSVFISQFGSQKVAVIGAVSKPGTYSLRKGANSMLELLSEAGGMTEKAGNYLNFIPSELSGVRADSEEGRAQLALALSEGEVNTGSGIQIYLDQVLGTTGGIPLEVPVRGGDMIIVPEAGKVTVEGEVQKPGAIELGRQMTLLGALAAAGGITYGAKVDEVEVVRDVAVDEQGRLVLDLERIARGEDRDVRLRSGDIVRVPSHSRRRLAQDTFESISRILNFGVGGSVNLAH